MRRAAAIVGSVLALFSAAGRAGAEPLFRLPVDGSPVICAYYDHGGSDWHCGGVRYSGHRGTDFAVAYGTPIVAAADGVVVETEDGYADHCNTGNCAGGPTGLGNHVLLEHPDGTRTYYGHMKIWSVAVSPGQDVGCGDQLGQVGSSGLSTGNHVHFQVGTWRDEQDPYRGGCSDRGSSLWVDQGGYGRGGGCTDGLPASTCAPDPSCRGAMDVRRCEGDVVLACTGGRDQSHDCAPEGLTCADDGDGPRCVAPRCLSAPSGTTCEGAVLVSCLDGLIASERDCAAEGASCDADAANCVAREGLDETGGDPDAPPQGDPGWGGNAAARPAGGLSGGCRATPGQATGSAVGAAWLALALVALRIGGRRRAARTLRSPGA